MSGARRFRKEYRRTCTLSWTVCIVAVLGSLLAFSPDRALASPGAVVQPSASVVSTDALPTAQINGNVWAQVVHGNVVYAGGQFSAARPAGAAPGKRQVRRGNLMAYNIETGQMYAFAPSLNAAVRALALSPDGRRLYVGGAFTLANGSRHAGIAAFDTVSGGLIRTWAPQINGTVLSIVASSTTVYVGGQLYGSDRVKLGGLAAFEVSTGKLTRWHPVANGAVNAMVLAPGGTRIIVGGAFSAIDRTPAYGMAALSPQNGALGTWGATAVVRDAGRHSAILSLSTDGTSIFGTGYVYGGPGGNLEGAFSANPVTGAINWVEDCHGDSYSSYASGGVLYVVGHAHNCANIGGFGDTAPKRALAFTTSRTGTVDKSTLSGYANFGGQPSPSLLNWFPDLTPGNSTRTGQAAWSVTGRGAYVVMGGEFLAVNGVPQQGLARFVRRAAAPNKQGPQLSGSDYPLSGTAAGSRSVGLTWRANWDPDDQRLTYRVVRADNAAAPLFTRTMTSQFWNRAAMSYTDSGLAPSTTYSYTIRVSDPWGNTVASRRLSVTTTPDQPEGEPATRL